jgi:hydrogenase maturation factor
LATAKKNKANEIVRQLVRSGIPASIVGEVVEKKRGIAVVEKGKSVRLVHPKADPFWARFEEYIKLNSLK